MRTKKSFNYGRLHFPGNIISISLVISYQYP